MRQHKSESLIDLLNVRIEEKENELFVREIESDSQWTYRQFYDEVMQRKKIFVDAGMHNGDKVCLIYHNSFEFMLNFYAILYAGGVFTPINPDFKEKEIEYIIRDVNCKYILTACENDSIKNFAEIINCIQINDKIKLTEIDNHLCEDKREDNLIEDTVLILYTSGTTSSAKGVMLTNCNLLQEMKNIMEAHELTSQDKVLCVLPWFHINGLVITMLTPLMAGHEIIIARKFSTRNFWRWVEQYQITWFSAVPTIYSYLLESPQKNLKTSLRFARSASASLPVHILKTFEEQYGIMIIESYGMTEGGSQLTTNPLPPKVRKTGSVGIPYGLEMKIMADGKVCQTNETGEVMFRGASITGGYYKKKEETQNGFEGEWLKTGDLGYFDEDGYLFLCGRKKELINRAGEKFSPKEIEDVLYQYSGIKLAACIGVPDAVYGEEVVGFCVPRENAVLVEENMIEFCKRYLVDYKVPKKIYVIDDIPLGGNGGKVQRLKLLEKYKELEGIKND